MARTLLTLLFLLGSSVCTLDLSCYHNLQPPYLITNSRNTTQLYQFDELTAHTLRSMHDLDPWWYNGKNFRDRTQVYKKFLAAGGCAVAIPQQNYPSLTGWYFDRGSDTVAVLSFFHAAAHAPYVESFKNVDLLIFEYQPHAITNQLLCPYQTSLLNHAQDTQAAISWLRTQKQYASVVGLGVCRSSFIYAYAQARSHNTHFDKLILDSPFFSIENFLHIIASDPLVTCYGRNLWHVFPARVRWLFTTLGAGTIAHLLAKTLWADTNDIHILNYTKQITVPTLIVHGTSDILLSLEQVHALWSSLGSSYKALLVTDNQHSRNHCRDDKELYAHIVGTFLSTDAVRCSFTDEQNCDTFLL